MSLNVMKYKFLGIEEVDMTCEFCHKKHIGKAFTFQDLDVGEIVRFGSSCAKKAIGLTSRDIDVMKAKKKYEITCKYQSLISKAPYSEKSALLEEQIKAEKPYW